MSEAGNRHAAALGCGMVRCDAGSFRVEKDNGLVGLATMGARIKFRPHPEPGKWLGRASRFASADLLCRPSGCDCIGLRVSSRANSCRPARRRRSRHQPPGRDIRGAVPREEIVEGD